MLTAEAHVQTGRPSRYLVQLCQHFSHKGGFLGHRQPAFLMPDLMHVEWSETHGTVSFGWGQCTIQASTGTLTLRAEADNEENLQRVQDVVTRHLSRFGRRDHLTVTWQQPATPGTQPRNAGWPAGKRPYYSGLAYQACSRQPAASCRH